MYQIFYAEDTLGSASKKKLINVFLYVLTVIGLSTGNDKIFVVKIFRNVKKSLQCLQ